MNILLDSPLPSSVLSKRDYDNRILMIFLIIMVLLISIGLLFLNVSNSVDRTITPPPSSEEPQDLPVRTINV